MTGKTVVMVVGIEGETLRILKQILDQFWVCGVSDFQVGRILFDCVTLQLSALVVNGCVWKAEADQTADFVGWVRAKGFKGLVIVIADDPAYPAKRVGADYVVGCNEIGKVPEILK